MPNNAGEFDPLEPPGPAATGPLPEYLRSPAGLNLLAAGQAVVGLLLLFIGYRLAAAAGAGTATWVAAIFPGALFLTSGLGLALRRGWGWWLTCTIYYFTFFNMPAQVVLWTLGKADFPVVLHLLVFGFATLILTYLNRVDVIRFLRFGSPDGRPGRWMRASPAVAGVLAAAILALITAVSPGGLLSP